jgi:hypothetical protein
VLTRAKRASNSEDDKVLQTPAGFLPNNALEMRWMDQALEPLH